MRMFLILAGLTLSLAAASQEIYRWVDKNGVVHYSDQPDSPDAVLITVLEPNAYEPAAAPGAASAGSEPEDGPAVSPYESLSIIQPTPDQVFFGSDTTVAVTAELDGTLRPDHSVVFFVNGNRRPAAGLGIELTNLERGTHFLRASILDQNGDPVITSQQIAFHVRMASIQNPQKPVPARPQLPRPRTQPVPANTPGN